LDEVTLRKLYNWTMQFASGPNALLALIVVSFAESSFFPIPPDILLVPMILAARDKAFKIAAWCTIASVAGGILGYWIGASLYGTVGQWIIDFYGMGDKVESFRHAYQHYGAWIILLKGLTPIPYKLVAIASGFSGYNFLEFVVLSIITRGVRFTIEGWLLAHYGEPVRNFIEKRLELVFTASAAVVIFGLVVVKYIF
jgi:membrane protein YqaA with SNARE-associated domain